MYETLFVFYPWLKALHLVAIVAWFAALFYLPRLFVYHAQTTNANTIATFKTMESRLYKSIANPSVAVVFIVGLVLLYMQPALLKQGWMHVKLLLVVSLLVYHIICGRYLRAFLADKNNKSHTFYRWFNEYPTLVLVIVVVLVMVRP